MPSPETFKQDLLIEFRNIAEATNLESSLGQTLEELKEELRLKKQLGEDDLDTLQKVVTISDRYKKATLDINKARSNVFALFNGDLQTILLDTEFELTIDGYTFKIYRGEEEKVYGGIKFEATRIE